MEKYIVVYSWDENELADRVNALLKDKWELQGGVSISISTIKEDDGETRFDIFFAQALVK